MTQSAFWVVSGENYVREAEVSANSLAKVMPSVERWCFSPDSVESSSFTNIVKLPPRTSEAWYVDCCRYVTLAMDILPEQVLYLDSDTYFIAEVPEVFDLLKHFDICLAHAPLRISAPTIKPIPDCFPEFNIAVIAMNNTPTIRGLWQKVATQLKDNLSVYGNNDQAPLREVLFDSRIRFAVLPPEYDFHFRLGAYLSYRAKILHGRGDYESVAKSINSGTVGPRTWRVWNGHQIERP